MIIAPSDPSATSDPRGITDPGQSVPSVSNLELETTTMHRSVGSAAVDTNEPTIAPALPLPPLHPSSFIIHPSAFGPLSQDLATVTPVHDVAKYRATRKPVAHYEHELSLFITLPDSIREEIETLFAAFALVDTYVKARLSVQKSCQSVFASLAHLRGSWKTFRANYDLWQKTSDWVSLVNCAKAGAAWQNRDDGLPSLFLDYCEKVIGKFKRGDGAQQALLAVHRQWRTGRNLNGEQEPIPGYGTRPMTLNGRPVTGGYWQDWFETDGYKLLGMARRPLPSECPALPRGWDISNIRRHIEARSVLTKPVKLLIQQGVSAAKEVLPHHLRTRADLLFLSEITFDDVRTDWVIRDPATGQTCELWLLVARDTATAMALGFVMHMSVMRADGSKPHLGLKEMKQLAAYLLERYPLPPYQCTWVIERGTATLSEGSARALQEMLPGQIRISYTSMIGGKSPAGYQEKKKGNSRGKASHESHNRLIHTQTSYIPGQTGSRWDIRPADLQARADEDVATWSLSQRLPDHLRGQLKYSLLDWTQAREHLFRIFIEQNFRQDHALEGFDRVVEWLDQQTGKWMPQNTFPSLQLSNTPPTRTRMEMPVERAIKLMAPYAGQWHKVSPDIIIAFLSHTVKTISKHMLKPSGEIIFTHERKDITFAPPSTFHPQPSTSLLGYYSPDDPRFLHVTNGRGAVLGTWYRRDRNGHHDQELVEQAMRYTANALKAAQEIANLVTTDERAELESNRTHNQDVAAKAGLDRGNEYLDVAASQLPAVSEPCRIVQSVSPVAAALTSIPIQRRKTQDTNAADEALAASLDRL